MNKENKQKNIEERILDKISKDHIEPKPKWEFLLQNSYFWILGILTISLGALAFSTSIFIFQNIKWEIYKATHNNIFTFTIDFIPFLWVILFIIFIVFTHHIVRKTRNGYKHHMTMVIGLSLFISIALGMFLANVGVGKGVDNNFDGRVPFYHSIEMRNNESWDKPESGLLIGKVTIVGGDFILTSHDEKNWSLLTNEIDEEILINLSNGSLVRIIGFEENEHFHVCGILPEDMIIEGKKRGPKLYLERKGFVERSKECEDVRPYRRLID